MIAILYLTIIIIGLFVGGSIAAKENYDAIQRGKERQRQGINRAGVYIDRLGATRSLTNHERVSIDNLYCAESEGRDAYMYDEHGNPIRNMSEEIRQERLAQAKSNPDPRRTVVLWKNGTNPVLAGRKGNPYYSGNQYKDLETGDIYVCRHFDLPNEISHLGSCSFYMDVNTGLLVRETDGEKYDMQRGYNTTPLSDCEKFIIFFNEKQKGEGYLNKSNIPSTSGWNTEEDEYDRCRRMKRFYCNEYEYTDNPCDIKR